MGMEEKLTCGVPWDAFEGGAVRQRELRLSEAEAGEVRRTCPGAAMEPLGHPRNGRQWYRVTLEGVDRRA